jgi:hypothetical protein
MWRIWAIFPLQFLCRGQNLVKIGGKLRVEPVTVVAFQFRLPQCQRFFIFIFSNFTLAVKIIIYEILAMNIIRSFLWRVF